MARLNENIPTKLKRRLNYDTLKSDIQNIIEYELNIHLINDVVDCVIAACDWEVNNISDDMFNEYNITLEPKEKDKLYYFLVDNFGKMISEYYEKEKGKLKESKKRIIVTESQYKRLFEQKKSKKEIFQDVINDTLKDIKRQCDGLYSDNNDVGFQTCDDIEIIDSIMVNEVEMMTGARTDMYGNMHDATPSIYIKLTTNYSNIKDVNDFDEFIYDLKWMLKNSTGLPIVFDYKTNNIRKIKE